MKVQKLFVGFFFKQESSTRHCIRSSQRFFYEYFALFIFSHVFHFLWLRDESFGYEFTLSFERFFF